MKKRISKKKRTDKRLLERMENHYLHSKGFVGRNICYAILFDGKYYGHIVGGSATRFLPGRNEFLGISLKSLNNVVNNIFFNVERLNGKYPFRNFTSYVVERFTYRVKIDWENKYGDNVLGFESLVELPRTGDLYKKAGWIEVGITKGYTCKRIVGVGKEYGTHKNYGQREYSAINHLRWAI